MAPRSLVSLVILLAALPATAQIPRVIGYQGRLLRADGTAATGTASVTFQVFGSETGGTPLWQETQTLGLSEGYYSTFLGLVAPPQDSLFEAGARWLEVKVGSETLSPRQPVGSVAYALSARSVSGGAADVTSLRVSGQTVVDSDGRLAGAARYLAGQGLAIDDASRTLALQACSTGQILVHDATGWACASANPGTVTNVSAAAPLVVTEGTSVPQLSIAQAGVSSAGFLSSTDWNSFNTKYGALTQCGGDLSGTLAAPVVTRLQSRPVAPTEPGNGQVLKWNAATTRWEPSADLNSGGTVTGVVATAPLTAQNGTTNAELSIAAASGTSDGYLASGDWSRFNSKYDAATQCGGDLDGDLAAPIVAKLQGIRVDTTIPALAQVLRYDGSRWAPASLGILDVGGLSTGYVDLSGSQAISGTKSFTAAPTFGTPLAVSSGGTGTTSEAAGRVFASPDGASGAPAFRSLVADDLPGLDASKITGGTLSVSRGGTGTPGVFGSGSVLFAGTSGAYSQNAAAFHWDDTNARLGIGTVSPAYRLDVRGGDINTSGNIYATGSLYASSVTASLTGNVTGNLTGNVAGNVSGNVTGDLTGNVNGNVAGNLTGNVNGNVTGNLAGSVTGSLTGYMVMTAGAPAVEGAVRYFAGHFQGYDGSRWLNLDNVPPPVVTAINPTLGSTNGGLLVTITGSNFQPLAGTTLVYIDELSCTGVTVTSASVLTCTTPADPSEGAKDVKVTNPDFLSGTLGTGFTYHRPPVIATVAPSFVSTLGNTTVTIDGTDFVATPAIYFGTNTSATVSLSGSTRITAVAPAASTGAAGIKVVNPDGLFVTHAGVTYDVPPSISQISPAAVSTAGGMTITIDGGSFVGTPTVLLGTVTATGVTRVSATRLTATAPAASAGAVTVKVTNPDGLFATGTGLSYDVPPTLSSMTPTTVSGAGGATVTINGSGYVSLPTVLFGTTPASSVTFVNSGQIRAVVPSMGAANATVTVRNPDLLSVTSSGTISVEVSGQTMYFDAADSTSNTGSGTTWYDISGNGVNATMVGSLSRGTLGGYPTMVFNPSNGSGAQFNNSTLNTQAFSAIYWVYSQLTTSDSNDGGLYVNRPDNNVNSSNWIWFGKYSSDVWYFRVDNGSCCNDLSGNSFSSSVPANQWKMVHFAFGVGVSNGWKWGVDGTNLYSATLSARPNSQDSSTSTIGFGHQGSGSYWRGGIASTRFYNRLLSDTEISNEFTRLKSRYGR